MSDTTAFLSGCAITGVAAVLMLGGGFAVGQYRNPSPGLMPSPVQSLPAVPTTATPIPVPPYAGSLDADRESQLARDLEQQHAESAALKSQVEELKSQVEQQRTDMQRLTAQLQAQQDSFNAIAARQNQTPPLNGGQSQTLLMGAVGLGFFVVLMGGGALVIGVVVLMMQSQRRSSRPIQVIHPVQPTYSFGDQEFLPPIRQRRARQINYYEE